MTTPPRGIVVGNALITFDKRVSEQAIAEFRRAFGGTDEQATDAIKRISATVGACTHAEAVTVNSVVTGETLAWLCPGCDTQLDADFGDVLAARVRKEAAARERRVTCTHDDIVEITTYEDLPNRRGLCADCGQGLTEEPGGCWRPDPERNNP